MKYFFSLAFLLFAFLYSSAQNNYSAIILDEISKQPIEGVSIFINNTSIGTSSDKYGRFSIPIKNAISEIVFSVIEYQPFSFLFKGRQDPSDTIYLRPKDKTLEEVVIQSALKDGWEKWGTLFILNFLGQTEEAADRSIENIEVLRFFYDEKLMELSVQARQPLLIRNKALGYLIQYSLIEFTYNQKKRITYYTGYPFFIPILGNNRQESRWAKKRKECYEGSMMQFFRALYLNKTDSLGFKMNASKYVKNMAKSRLRDSLIHQGTYSNLSHEKNKILHQPDSFFVMQNQIKADSIAFAEDSTTAGLFFRDYLTISYLPKKMNSNIASLMLSHNRDMISHLQLIHQTPIYFFHDGSYFNSIDLLTSGYWSISEKIARMLPYNYKP